VARVSGRQQLRAALTSGRRVVGTFVKLPTVDVVELTQSAGFDFAVIDLEHSTLAEADALALVRHASVLGLPALVRVPQVDPALINRLLESGAAGIQLSMLRRVSQAQELTAATRYAPRGTRSISLAQHSAAFGAGGLAGYLRQEADEPPLLVGQIETAQTDPLDKLLPGLDVCFVGTTDLSVDLGDVPVADAVARVEAGARSAGVAFGGWAPSIEAAPDLGLARAGYLVIGSDLQMLAAGLRRSLNDQPA
jgi:4-hydroxy-2-oxoheptanedioate aldolase